MSSSDTEGELNTETDSSAEVSGVAVRNSRRRHSQKNCKLPPFNGKEKWEVWFNRFEAVASRRGWSSEEKLDETTT